MDFDWNILLNDLGIIVCIVGSIFIINKKWLRLFKANVPLEKKGEINAQEIENMTKQFFSTPAGVVITQSLHLEVNRVTESYKKAEVWRLILLGLCSFRESPNTLNFTQRYALISYVISSAPKGWGIEPQMISELLLEIEKEVDKFSNQEIVKAANAFTFEYNKSKNSVPGDTNPLENMAL